MFGAYIKTIYICSVIINQKQIIMEAMTRIQKETNKIAANVARCVNRWSQSGSALVSRVNQLVDTYMDGLEFETPLAESMFRGAVFTAINKNHALTHRIIFPPVFMDANGNYTTDSSKWV